MRVPGPKQLLPHSAVALYSDSDSSKTARIGAQTHPNCTMFCVRLAMAKISNLRGARAYLGLIWGAF